MWNSVKRSHNINRRVEVRHFRTEKAHGLTDYAVKQELTLLFLDATASVPQLLSTSGPNHLWTLTPSVGGRILHGLTASHSREDLSRPTTSHTYISPFHLNHDLRRVSLDKEKKKKKNSLPIPYGYPSRISSFGHILYFAFCPQLLPSTAWHCLTLPNYISMQTVVRVHSLN